MAAADSERCSVWIEAVSRDVLTPFAVGAGRVGAVRESFSYRCLVAPTFRQPRLAWRFPSKADRALVLVRLPVAAHF